MDRAAFVADRMLRVALRSLPSGARLTRRIVGYAASSSSSSAAMPLRRFATAAAAEADVSLDKRGKVRENVVDTTATFNRMPLGSAKYRWATKPTFQTSPALEQWATSSAADVSTAVKATVETVEQAEAVFSDSALKTRVPPLFFNAEPHNDMHRFGHLPRSYSLPLPPASHSDSFFRH
jgi:hypothetical protein